MMVIMRCASVLYAQGAECTEVCFGKAFLTLTVCQASSAGCVIVIMRCASVSYAQAAESTKACSGKAFDAFSMSCQPGWMHDRHHALRICVKRRRVLNALRLASVKPLDTFTVSCQPCWLHDGHHALRICVYAQGAECTKACSGKAF